MWAAIDAADAQGVRPSRILAATRSGELDGLTQAFALPDATFWNGLKRVRHERREEADPIPPGEESAEANAVVREAIQIARRELQACKKALRDTAPGDAQRVPISREIEHWQRLCKGYEKKAQKKPQQTDAATEANRGLSRSSPLLDLVHAKRKEAATSSPHTPTTSEPTPSLSTSS